MQSGKGKRTSNKHKYYDSCSACMTYLMNDIKSHSADISESDKEILSLFHQINDPSLQQSILAILRHFK